MGIVLGGVVILLTLLACGWVAVKDATEYTPYRWSFLFWLILGCGLFLGVLMIAAHFLGWGW
jgi:multisubunit Na+/H+ antiporter MnhB subunit